MAPSVSADVPLTLEAPTSTTEVNGLVEQPRLAVARYDEFFSQRTFSTEWKKTVKGDRARKASRKKPVLIVRRVIDKQGQLEETLVDIKSSALREILKTAHGTHVNISDMKPEVSIEVLFHSRRHFQERLNEERANDPLDKDLIFELEAMVNLIEEDYGATTSDVERLISEGRITYALLWSLFPPGCLVYRRHPQLNQHQVMKYQVSDYTTIEQVPHFVMLCEIISNDGNHFGLAQIKTQIKTFIGTVRIQDLDFLPLRHHPDHEKIYGDVVSRGLKFSRLEQQLFETSGSAFLEVGERFKDSELRVFTANGRVMINSKSFGGFALENLQPVEWSDTAFESLVLGRNEKQIIRALIQQHSNRKNTLDDVISGKGKGFIGLLSGNPGCGKTLTAEAVAEAVQMPLYVVGAGDLGISARDVDHALLRIFELAARWNAVVLLDEADVFLHKRTPLALAQNALVAVFLRHLEYYQGILILTTNMNENFDPAFESRIHFCMRYPDLDHSSRKSVWETFVQRALGDRSGFTEAHFNYLADHKLNGRQIKNTVNVAFSLAADEEASLTVSHVERVLVAKDHWDKQFQPTKTSLRQQLVLFLRENRWLFGGMVVLLALLIQLNLLGASISYEPNVTLSSGGNCTKFRVTRMF
ncbi:hypothetical protein DXG01_011141 [Tephrocybe rancida]|nr:hypothetical protein DXG01_011141 [Tephrocybe rancida]